MKNEKKTIQYKKKKKIHTAERVVEQTVTH